MSTKGRANPRIVCCAIPIARAAGKVLVITSRKRQDRWVCEYFHTNYFVFSVGCMVPNPTLPLTTSTILTVPKGGWEQSDVVLEAAASREALEEGLNLCPSNRLLT